MNKIKIPNLAVMSDEEVKTWVGTLTTDLVYKNLAAITEAVMERLGEDARISTSTYQSPKIVYLVENSA